MAQKGINMQVKEAKAEIAGVVNKYLQQLPVSVVEIILESFVFEINQTCGAICMQETEQYNKELKEESQKEEK